jgi:Sec-independent protein translocase protein TatA
MLAELLQPTHPLILAAVLVLFFGGRWFAKLGNGFRDAVRNFRNAAGTPPFKIANCSLRSNTR